eukprot:g12776.t1
MGGNELNFIMSTMPSTTPAATSSSSSMATADRSLIFPGPPSCLHECKQERPSYKAAKRRYETDGCTGEVITRYGSFLTNLQCYPHPCALAEHRCVTDLEKLVQSATSEMNRLFAEKPLIPRDFGLHLPRAMLQNRALSATQLETVALAAAKLSGGAAAGSCAASGDAAGMASNSASVLQIGVLGGVSAASNKRPLSEEEQRAAQSGSSKVRRLEEGAGTPSNSLVCAAPGAVPQPTPSSSSASPGRCPPGFLVGEGTGCGKGRIVVATMIHFWNARNEKRHVWVSKSKNLIADAERDLGDLREYLPRGMQLFHLGDLKKFSAANGILFLSYQQLTNPRNQSLFANWFNYAKSTTAAAGAGRGTSRGGGVLAFDEAHSAKNLKIVFALESCGKSSAVSGDLDEQKSSNTGKAVYNAQMLWMPGAHVLYLSATAATEPSNLAYMPRLGAWEKVGFNSFECLLNELGLAGLQLFHWQLRESGSATTRRISLEGVDFHVKNVQTTEAENSRYDRCVDLLEETWARFLETFDAYQDVYCAKYASRAGQARRRGKCYSAWDDEKADVDAVKLEYVGLWAGLCQRFWKQLVVCGKLAEAISVCEDKLKRGDTQVVMSLWATGESAARKHGLDEEDALFAESTDADAGWERGHRGIPAAHVASGSHLPALRDAADAIMALDSPAEDSDVDEEDKQSSDDADAPEGAFKRFSLCEGMVLNFINDHFFCDGKYDANVGSWENAPLVASIAPDENKDRSKRESHRLYRVVTDLTDKWKEQKLPRNALDTIVNHFGRENVAEISGRQTQTIDSAEEPPRIVARRASDNRAEALAFQRGQKAVAVITDAGSTGISLHADAKHFPPPTKVKRRHMIVIEFPWAGDKFTQQIGRVHRSGQAHVPSYTLLVSKTLENVDMAGSGVEARFLSALTRRIKSLGAMTRGDVSESGFARQLDALLESHHYAAGIGEAASVRVAAKLKKKYLLEKEGASSAGFFLDGDGFLLDDDAADIAVQQRAGEDVPPHHAAANGDAGKYLRLFGSETKFATSRLFGLASLGQGKMSNKFEKARALNRFLNTLPCFTLAEQREIFREFEETLQGLSKSHGSGPGAAGVGVTDLGEVVLDSVVEIALDILPRCADSPWYYGLLLPEGCSFEEVVALIRTADGRGGPLELKAPGTRNRAKKGASGEDRDRIILKQLEARATATNGNSTQLFLRFDKVLHKRGNAERKGTVMNGTASVQLPDHRQQDGGGGELVTVHFEGASASEREQVPATELRHNILDKLLSSGTKPRGQNANPLRDKEKLQFFRLLVLLLRSAAQGDTTSAEAASAVPDEKAFGDEIKQETAETLKLKKDHHRLLQRVYPPLPHERQNDNRENEKKALEQIRSMQNTVMKYWKEFCDLEFK